MKSNLKALLKIQLLNFWGINKLKYSQDKKEKRGKIGMSILWILLLAYFLMLSCGFAIACIAFNMSNMLLPLSFLLSTLVVFIFAFFRSTIILKLKDFDMVLSLPVRVEHIILSRVAIVYFQSCIVTLICMLPSYIAYGVSSKETALYYILSVISMLFIPAIPIIVSFFISCLFALISSKFKFKKSISVILNLAFILLVFFGSFSLSTVSSSDLQATFSDLGNKIANIYPIANLYSNALASGNIFGVLIFILTSVLLLWVFLKFINKFFISMNERLSVNKKNKSYRFNNHKQGSTLMALTKNEFKRYSNTTIWIVNTCFSVILLLAIGVLLVFVSPDQLVSMITSEDISTISGDAQLLQIIQMLVIPLIPVLISFFVAASPTTTASISMEGQSLWIIQSIPVPTKTIYLSKILMNIILVAPAIIISGVLISVSLKLNLLNSIVMFLEPLSFLVFTSVMGLFFNLKYPNFDWQAEVEVVKRGGAVFASMITCFITIILLVVLLFLTGLSYPYLIHIAYSIIMLVIASIVYKKICKKSVSNII